MFVFSRFMSTLFNGNFKFYFTASGLVSHDLLQQLFTSVISHRGMKHVFISVYQQTHGRTRAHDNENNPTKTRQLL